MSDEDRAILRHFLLMFLTTGCSPEQLDDAAWWGGKVALATSLSGGPGLGHTGAILEAERRYFSAVKTLRGRLGGHAMNNDEAGLLLAVRERPDDDLPRLIYADWLEENGRAQTLPCPTCSRYADDPCPECDGSKTLTTAAYGMSRMLCQTCKGSGTFPPGYHPERNPGSGRYEGGWANCKTCNASASPTPGFLVQSDGRRERAEFIRVQVELAGWLAKPCSVAAGTWRRGFYSGGAVVEAWAKSPPARCCMPLNDDWPGEPSGLCVKCARIERLGRRQQEFRDFLGLRRLPDVLALRDLLDNASVEVGGRLIWHGAGLNRIVVRRGFVAEVRCPWQAWKEYGAAIVAAHPIERVELIGKAPADVRHRRGGRPRRYCWFVESLGGTDGPASLPECLMPGGRRRWNHATREKAYDALSAACLKYARKELDAAKAEG